MKKIISWSLTLVLLLSLSACQSIGIQTTSPPAIHTPGSSGTAKPIMKETPKLTVSFGAGDFFDAATGIYAWNYDNGDGTRSGIKADGPHPLDLYEYLSPVETTDSLLELQFEVPPQSVTVRCWNDTCWGNTQSDSETATVSGNMMELKEGGWIYEVKAVWTGENLAASGTVHYVFYLIKHSVQFAHSHSPAAHPKFVVNPMEGYCGNTVTTIRTDHLEYSFMGTDSVTLTDILINLEYDPAMVCKCVPDFYVETEFGITYGVSFSGYARCENGQVDLTGEQLETIRRIFDAQTKGNT